LMSGRRWELNLHELWDFSTADWEKRLRSNALSAGWPRPPTWMGQDYFIFRRGLFGNIPPFAIGRTRYDNWLIWKARSLGVDVIDSSSQVMAIHQTHESPYRNTQNPSIEVKQNLELAGTDRYLFYLLDATHVLTPKGPRRARSMLHIRRRIITFPTLHPSLGRFIVPIGRPLSRFLAPPTADKKDMSKKA